MILSGALKNYTRTMFLIFLAFAVIPVTCCPVSAMSEELRIGIIGDQTGTYKVEEAYAALQKSVEILVEQDITAFLHVGDIAESQEPDEVFTRHLNSTMDIMAGPGKPWFITPGDHDVNPRAFEQASNDRSMETIFRQEYGKRNPLASEHLYYSFDIGDYHFIALYSHDNLHVDPRWGNSFLSKVSEKQLEWLADDLAKNKDRAGIVVFTHHPLWYNWTGWMPVHALLKKYPVLTVIAGHFHYDQDEGSLDGIRYVVLGAAGGNLKKASREAGGVWHATVLTLMGRSANFRLIPLDSGEALDLTPREDMDRVQALESMLMELFNFDQDNPICLKDDRLVASCNSSEPAKLKLLRIGNPIDVHVRVTLQFLSDKVKMEAAEFAGNTCATMEGDHRCVLAPGKRIAISNNSDVQLTFQCQAPSMFWQARILAIPQNLPVPGDKLHLNVELSFAGRSGRMSVQGTGTAEIKSCP